MKQLEEMILKEGKVLPGDILKVGGFLNQNIDTGLLTQMGEEIARLYDGCGVNKILTIEASGIAIAAAAGMAMGVPVLFAKKHRTSNVDGSVYTTVVHSFTHDEDYNVVVSRDYLTSSDRVLLIDDFLANGQALNGLIDLCNQAGAELVGVAIAIEKCFTGAGDAFRAKGVRLESLAMIESMTDCEVTFRS
ncbi:MAG: xanthine phosphoribosyltransferase [Atopobiaceae bacterium]|nr:xanthine phosphoribosyltransferase [Atopobiaceae bacterium]MBQ3282227.1 xanthine phosphoribosyltransferase [Atopobiaceae bacterium]